MDGSVERWSERLQPSNPTASTTLVASTPIVALSQAININRLASALAYKKFMTQPHTIAAYCRTGHSTRVKLAPSPLYFKTLKRARLTGPTFSEAAPPLFVQRPPFQLVKKIMYYYSSPNAPNRTLKLTRAVLSQGPPRDAPNI